MPASHPQRLVGGWRIGPTTLTLFKRLYTQSHLKTTVWDTKTCICWSWWKFLWDFQFLVLENNNTKTELPSCRSQGPIPATSGPTIFIVWDRVSYWDLGFDNQPSMLLYLAFHMSLGSNSCHHTCKASTLITELSWNSYKSQMTLAFINTHIVYLLLKTKCKYFSDTEQHTNPFGNICSRSKHILMLRLGNKVNIVDCPKILPMVLETEAKQ